MATILQMTFINPFACMEIVVFFIKKSLKYASFGLDELTEITHQSPNRVHKFWDVYDSLT